MVDLKIGWYNSHFTMLITRRHVICNMSKYAKNYKKQD
jgi:hypothetical protein